MVVLTTSRDLAERLPRPSIFVPTMGALHEGHVSLVRQGVRLSRSLSDSPSTEPPPPVVVSIFVNPTQFGQAEDLARYPRTLEADLHACERAGADIVFAPDANQVYPPGVSIPTPPLPRVAAEPGLEDAARPGHFAGVCQVVRCLFDLVRPSHAIFGEKDWQQLQVIRAMVAAERLPIQIVPGPTVRDEDGLALSSRNRFLSAEDRRRGLALVGALRAASGASTPWEAEQMLTDRLAAHAITPDYAVVRDAETLAPRLGAAPQHWDRARPMRAVLAARVGGVRLLDNAAWTGA